MAVPEWTEHTTDFVLIYCYLEKKMQSLMDSLALGLILGFKPKLISASI